MPSYENIRGSRVEIFSCSYVSYVTDLYKTQSCAGVTDLCLPRTSLVLFLLSCGCRAEISALHRHCLFCYFCPIVAEAVGRKEMYRITEAPRKESNHVFLASGARPACHPGRKFVVTQEAF